jgi:hypothetical protein
MKGTVTTNVVNSDLVPLHERLAGSEDFAANAASNAAARDEVLAWRESPPAALELGCHRQLEIDRRCLPTEHVHHLSEAQPEVFVLENHDLIRLVRRGAVETRPAALVFDLAPKKSLPS